MKYEVILYWSHEDDAFIAEIPELPGCMADGKTYQAALRAVERVAKQWIAVAKELGRDVPRAKGRLLYA
ncbi:MAG: type II toxin-antitoxin system HicB family antitoxin [Planctomycetes bacterium]|nr:type II toxin-antitoxin system HicB family antitoxin [Planctomycetota bacterium]